VAGMACCVQVALLPDLTNIPSITQCGRGLAMAELGLPETQYAQSGAFSIAYQVMGSGPIDIVLVPASSRISTINMSCRATRKFSAG
jgi:hypothetical protein